MSICSVAVREVSDQFVVPQPASSARAAAARQNRDLRSVRLMRCVFMCEAEDYSQIRLRSKHAFALGAKLGNAAQVTPAK